MKRSVLTLMMSLMICLSGLHAFEKISSLKTFEQKIRKGNVIVEFYAPWCQHCPVMEENLKKFTPHKKNLHVIQVNIDKSPAIVDKYGTPQVPALLYIKDGKILDGYIGLKDLPALQKDYQHYFAAK